jgi:hypothetical protein
LVLLLGPKVKNVWSFRRASDLSVQDPFRWWTYSRIYDHFERFCCSLRICN